VLEFGDDPPLQTLSMHIPPLPHAGTRTDILVLVVLLLQAAEPAFDLHSLAAAIDVLMTNETSIRHEDSTQLLFIIIAYRITSLQPNGV
jgi:hypothetical protein